jgi:hypothetical protein
MCHTCMMHQSIAVNAHKTQTCHRQAPTSSCSAQHNFRQPHSATKPICFKPSRRGAVPVASLPESKYNLTMGHSSACVHAVLCMPCCVCRAVCFQNHMLLTMATELVRAARQHSAARQAQRRSVKLATAMHGMQTTCLSQTTHKTRDAAAITWHAGRCRH